MKIECTICKDIPIVPVRLHLKSRESIMCSEVLCRECWDSYCLQRMREVSSIKFCLACNRELKSQSTYKTHIKESYIVDPLLRAIVDEVTPAEKKIECPFCCLPVEYGRSPAHRVACDQRTTSCRHKDCRYIGLQKNVKQHEARCAFMMRLPRPQ